MKLRRFFFRALVICTVFVIVNLSVWFIQTSNTEDQSNQAKANISTSEPLLQPFPNNTEFYLLILVPSAVHEHQAFLERQAIRETWGRTPENPNQDYWWKVVFLLGCTQDEKSTAKILRESTQYNDILQGNFSDGYYSVTHKVLMGLKWATLRASVQFILKADPDVYIHVTRTVKWLQNGDFPARLYGGVIKWRERVPRAFGDSHAISRRLYGKDYYPPYAMGAFVMISQSIVPDMLNATITRSPIVYDDPYLGILSKEINVKPFLIKHFFFSLAIRYSFGKVVKSYSDCQLVDIFAIGDRIDYKMKHYLHNRFLKIDAMNLTKASPKCRWQNILEQSVLDGRLVDYFNQNANWFLKGN